MKYRLCVDEVGNSDTKASRDPNQRYLSLTAIALNLDYVAAVVHPELEKQSGITSAITPTPRLFTVKS